MALPVLDAIINASRGVGGDDDVVGTAVRDLVSPEAVLDGFESRWAMDALVVVEPLLHSPTSPQTDKADRENSRRRVSVPCIAVRDS